MPDQHNPYAAPGLRDAYDAGREAFARAPKPVSVDFEAFRRGWTDAEREWSERMAARATAVAAVLERIERPALGR